MASTKWAWLAAWSLAAVLGCDKNRGAGPAAPEPLVPKSAPEDPVPTAASSPEPQVSKGPDAPPLTTDPPKPPPPPRLAVPEETKFNAWERRDPTSERPLHEWDRANLVMMHRYFRDLECAHLTMIDQGDGYLSGTRTPEQWATHKRTVIVDLNTWQQTIFRDNPRIMEKSKYLGTLLEMHELVMSGIPKAYTTADDKAVRRAAMYWRVLIAKVTTYTLTLGVTFEVATASDCKGR